MNYLKDYYEDIFDYFKDYGMCLYDFHTKGVKDEDCIILLIQIMIYIIFKIILIQNNNYFMYFILIFLFL